MFDMAPLEPVDYLVIGHVTEDVTPAGPRLGGTAAFSGLTARALGLRVGVVTAAAESTSLAALDGMRVVRLASPQTTTFENRSGPQGRTQVLRAEAAPIPWEAVPQAWSSAPIVHLGPVAHEMDPAMAARFSATLLGVTPQGWMRTWDESGRVSPGRWEAAGIGKQAGAAVISREDAGGDEELIEEMAHHVRVLAVTEGPAGSVLHWNGDRRRFRAPEMAEVDATGAGDIYATALFVRLFTTRDPWEAARFATRLASFSVARPGLQGIPTQKEIEESMMEVLS